MLGVNIPVVDAIHPKIKSEVFIAAKIRTTSE